MQFIIRVSIEAPEERSSGIPQALVMLLPLILDALGVKAPTPAESEPETEEGQRPGNTPD